MSDRILFVDDEPNILQALQRKLRNRFDVETAGSGDEGLRCLRAKGPFAVVVSDMRMPGMDGGTFLAQARIEFPETVQIILSGQADLESLISAVNEGNVFRFLTKPCNDASLLRGVEAALVQHRLLKSERELIDGTLGALATLLTEARELSDPAAFRRSARVTECCAAMAQRLGLANPADLRMAATLSSLGPCGLTARSLARIPRLERVSRIVGAQDGQGATLASPEEVRAAEVLSAAMLLAHGLDRGQTRDQIFATLAASTTPPVLAALREADAVFEAQSKLSVDLPAGTTLSEDLMTRGGLVLAPKGATVTEELSQRARCLAYIKESTREASRASAVRRTGTNMTEQLR